MFSNARQMSRTWGRPTVLWSDSHRGAMGVCMSATMRVELKYLKQPKLDCNPVKLQFHEQQFVT